MSGMPPVFGRGPLVGISSTALSGVLVRGASSSGSPALATALGVEASATHLRHWHSPLGPRRSRPRR
jgi:hypothetical protein